MNGYSYSVNYLLTARQGNQYALCVYVLIHLVTPGFEMVNQYGQPILMAII